MNSHRHAAKASASAKLARLTSTSSHGTSSAGDGVDEDYGTAAAGPSDSAQYKRGGVVAGGKSKARMDRSPRGKKFEGSAQDRKEDKAGAKKAGMTMKQWEGSPADRKQDAAGEARGAFNRGGAVKGKTTVNIVVQQPGGDAAQRVPMPVPVGGPAPGMAPPAMVPPQAPPMPIPPAPMGPAMAGPGPMPMRKRGGRVLTAGAGSGEGRLELSRHAKGVR